MAKIKEPILVERPLITEVIYLFLKTKDKPVTMDEAQQFFLTFSKNPLAPKCVKELEFFNDENGNPFCEDLSYFLRFTRAIQGCPV